MAKQFKKRPPTKSEPSDLAKKVTSTGKDRKPWHLNGNESSKGTGFDKRPENAGRKKKIYTILKEKGYSKDDITIAFGEIAFYNISEIDEVLSNVELPMITRIVAKQFKTAYEDSDWGKIKEILDHTIGKPIQAIHNVNENIDISFED